MNACRILLLAGLSALAAQAGAFAPGGPIVATGHPNWPPFSWQQGNVITGAGAEVTQLVMRELGLSVTFRAVGNWKRAQAEVEAGNVDLLVAAYQTSARRQYMQFNMTPFADDANVVWVAKGRAFPFKKWEDLIGRNGTAMLGESYGQDFDTFIEQKLKVERVNTPQQNLQKLVMGRADYYPFSRYGGQIQVSQLGFDGQVEHLPGLISTEGVYLGISRKSALIAHMPKIEAIIARLRQDGTLDQIIRKHVSAAAAQR
jgi:polar amino acid transport system substrate-binding protein